MIKETGGNGIFGQAFFFNFQFSPWRIRLSLKRNALSEQWYINWVTNTEVSERINKKKNKKWKIGATEIDNAGQNPK